MQKDGRQVRCELRDYGESFGVEVRLVRDGEFYAGRRFENRAQAMHYGSVLRSDFERRGWGLDGTDAR